jgi:hypothetical protein
LFKHAHTICLSLYTKIAMGILNKFEIKGKRLRLKMKNSQRFALSKYSRRLFRLLEVFPTPVPFIASIANACSVYLF